MAAFKKSFLVLAVALLVLVGTSVTANAQTGLMTCTATAVPPLVRAEGIAELVGDIIAVCVVSNPQLFSTIPPNITTNVTVTLNTNITNTRSIITAPTGYPSITDAVLIVDEVNGTPTAVSTPSGLTKFVTGGSIPVPQYGGLLSNNTVQWLNVSIPTPFNELGGIFTTTTIRITNIRSNVSQLGIPPIGEGAFPSTQVVAFVSFTGPTTVPVTNNVLNVAIPMQGLIVRLRDSGFVNDLPPTIIGLQCVKQNINSSGDLVLDAAGSFTIRLSEGFATAFKTLGTPTTQPGATQWEDGYFTPPSGINNGGATQGTRFLIRFYNVPSGVRLGTPAVVTGTATGTHTLTIIKVGNTDANGAGALISALHPANEVTITGGSGFVVYEVIDDNPFTQENVIVPVTVGYTANTPNDLPAPGTMQVSASFAPVSTITTSQALANGIPVPRFVDTGAKKDVFGIARCITNLLFPFVTNQAGFDTGIAIANTSSDDKGTSQQSGNCTLYYFGGTTGGGAAPSSQTTAAITAGKVVAFTISGGNAAANITGTPGFQGYMMALCQFQYAHGFAFITDGFGGVPAIAEGYLALVVPWNGVAGSRFAGAGESLMH